MGVAALVLGILGLIGCSEHGSSLGTDSGAGGGHGGGGSPGDSSVTDSPAIDASEPDANLVGMCNDGGIFRPTVLPNPGDLVITEIMPQPLGDDTLTEWFEVKVLADVDLNGIGLDRAGDTSMPPDVISSPNCIRVVAGSYIVFARNIDMATNGGLPAASIKGTFGFSLVNGSTAVGSAGDIQILSGDSVIDAVSWTASTADHSLSLDPDLENAVLNDNVSTSNFCNGATSYGAGGFGTPGAINEQCTLLPPPGQCRNGGTNRAIVKPTAGHLLITEFLANPAAPPVADGTGDAQKEWFEVTNVGGTAVDLNELSVKSPSSAAIPVASVDCISIVPGGTALFARSSDATKNAGLPGVDATFTFSLVDSGANASVSVLDGATVLDSITWTSVTAGRSLQLDPDHFLNTTDNDVAAVTAGVYCLGTIAYGDLSNQGTPNSANPQCP